MVSPTEYSHVKIIPYDFSAIEKRIQNELDVGFKKTPILARDNYMIIGGYGALPFSGAIVVGYGEDNHMIIGESPIVHETLTLLMYQENQSLYAAYLTRLMQTDSWRHLQSAKNRLEKYNKLVKGGIKPERLQEFGINPVDEVKKSIYYERRADLGKARINILIEEGWPEMAMKEIFPELSNHKNEVYTLARNQFETFKRRLDFEEATKIAFTTKEFSI